MGLREDFDYHAEPAAADPFVIRGPQLLPYMEKPTCPACGNRRVTWFNNLLRILHGEQAWNHMGSSFCAGGKAPTEPSKHPVGALLGIEASHPCAGITEPHLHKQCAHFDYRFLMKTKNRL